MNCKNKSNENGFCAISVKSWDTVAYQYMPFCVAKQAVLDCETDRFRRWNRPFRKPKRYILKRCKYISHLQINFQPVFWAPPSLTRLISSPPLLCKKKSPSRHRTTTCPVPRRGLTIIITRPAGLTLHFSKPLLHLADGLDPVGVEGELGEEVLTVVVG